MPPALTVGQVVHQGSYRITAFLSEGGMGAIYLAQELGTLSRTVVIKQLLGALYGSTPKEAEEARKQFQAEARTLAALNHPHIPSVFGFFEERGQLYMVMEYVRGEDLGQQLSRPGRRGRPYPLKQVVGWGVVLCEILEYLERQSPPIVHHDIKPSNIVLNRETEHLWLIDFGIAKMRPVAAGGGGPAYTALFGTLGYAPPEQIRGLSEPRSDIYALAATLYHLATDDDPGEHNGLFPRIGELDLFGGLLTWALQEQPEHRPTASVFKSRLIQLQSQTPMQTPDGAKVYSPQELVGWCVANWEQAVQWLYQGHRLALQLDQVWHLIGDANALKAIVQRHQGDRNAGLDAALAHLDPERFGASTPRLEVPAVIDFGDIPAGVTAEKLVEIGNPGPRYVSGPILPPRWVKADRTTLSLVPGRRLSVRFSARIDQVGVGARRETFSIGGVRVRAVATTSRWATLAHALRRGGRSTGRALGKGARSTARGLGRGARATAGVVGEWLEGLGDSDVVPGLLGWLLIALGGALAGGLAGLVAWSLLGVLFVWFPALLPGGFVGWSFELGAGAVMWWWRDLADGRSLWGGALAIGVGAALWYALASAAGSVIGTAIHDEPVEAALNTAIGAAGGTAVGVAVAVVAGLASPLVALFGGPLYGAADVVQVAFFAGLLGCGVGGLIERSW